jgi:hypothetical protein
MSQSRREAGHDLGELQRLRDLLKEAWETYDDVCLGPRTALCDKCVVREKLRVAVQQPGASPTEPA